MCTSCAEPITCLSFNGSVIMSGSEDKYVPFVTINSSQLYEFMNKTTSLH